jgi:hypothetical protein
MFLPTTATTLSMTGSSLESVEPVTFCAVRGNTADASKKNAISLRIVVNYFLINK